MSPRQRDMKNIKEKLKSEILTKTYWNKIPYEKNLWGTISKSIEKVIDESIGTKKKSEIGLRRTFGFTMKMKKRLCPGRTEEALERVLTLCNSKMCNQFPLSGDKENIDLIYDKNEIIELKQWGTKETPLYAFVELIKNYTVIKNKKELKDINPVDIKTLTILAPWDYYKKFEKEGYKKLKGVIKDAERDIGIKITVKYIDIDRVAFENLCSKLAGGKVTNIDIGNKAEEIDAELRGKLERESWKDYDL